MYIQEQLKIDVFSDKFAIDDADHEVALVAIEPTNVHAFELLETIHVLEDDLDNVFSCPEVGFQLVHVKLHEFGVHEDAIS